MSRWYTKNNNAMKKRLPKFISIATIKLLMFALFVKKVAAYARFARLN